VTSHVLLKLLRESRLRNHVAREDRALFLRIAPQIERRLPQHLVEGSALRLAHDRPPPQAPRAYSIPSPLHRRWRRGTMLPEGFDAARVGGHGCPHPLRTVCLASVGTHRQSVTSARAPLTTVSPSSHSYARRPARPYGRAASADSPAHPASCR